MRLKFDLTKRETVPEDIQKSSLMWKNVHITEESAPGYSCKFLEIVVSFKNWTLKIEFAYKNYKNYKHLKETGYIK